MAPNTQDSIEPPRLDAVHRAAAQRTRHEIKAIYDTGKPLFTKDAMRKLGAELDVLRKGILAPRTIIHTGINGEDVELSFSPETLSLGGPSTTAPRW